jgi:hypothetical protein
MRIAQAFKGARVQMPSLLKSREQHQILIVSSKGIISGENESSSGEVGRGDVSLEAERWCPGIRGVA